jgi:2-alkyl-3-oxoalkanoate reductase
MRVFLTGGTGLLGSHITRELSTSGHEVVALVRPGSDTRFLRSNGARVCEGDVTQPVDILASAMADCEVVIHAAAISYGKYSRPTYERVNSCGTERVLRAAGAARCRLSAVISSIAVYGAVTRPVVETEWLEHEIPVGNHYAASKRQAEQLAWDLHGAGITPVVVVRPGVMYGEHDRSFTPRLLRLLRLRLLPLPGRGDTTIPVVYAGNVASGVVQAITCSGTAGKAYNLSGQPDLSLRQFVLKFAASTEMSAVVLPIPARLVQGAAQILEHCAGAIVPAARSGVRRAAWLALHDNPFDNSRAVRELRWYDQFTATDESIRQTAMWFKTAHA